ncbi:MAG: cytochrome c-type biogenesis protein CcmH [Octadecabacter sp.]|nr:cytochrome c-type biogenesis protein CcmH [Octadecabacter sp.]
MKWLVFILSILATPLVAVQPDEVLDDAALEIRARSLSADLRCPVCRNESIDESHADIARDLRLLLRERLVVGDTDEQAMQFLVDRYGEYILFNPRVAGVNILLWFAAPIMLLFSGGIAFVTIKVRSRAAEPVGLNAEEKKRLEELTGDKDSRATLIN